MLLAIPVQCDLLALHCFCGIIQGDDNLFSSATQGKEDQYDVTLPLFSSAEVVEYLIPEMAEGLLSKFPNNSSSWELDHSQSSIWSPLVPRHYGYSLDPDSGSSRGHGGKRKKFGRCGGFDLRSGSGKQKTKKRRSISPEDDAAEEEDGGRGCIPFPGKGMNKMMKAASRHFKKRKMTRRRKDSTVLRVKLST